MDLLLIIFLVVTTIVIIEILLRQTVLYVNKKFQWLIVEKDEVPELSEDLEKFLINGYDSELGWTRKPNTSHTEKGKTGETKWNTNEKGARMNPGYENKTSRISCYGDSFTFSRQVNDDETWEYFLSKILDTNVLNFGVGNYGIDQAILRMKREYVKNRTPIVILCVVPDTISRINSVWKHYYEYGNTFGFKPKFVMEKNELKLVKNFIDSKEKFSRYPEFLSEIKKYDYFYKNKFQKEKIHFPYIITVSKNFLRNMTIMFWVICKIVLKKLNQDTSKIDWKPMDLIMKINLKWRVDMFRNKNQKALLKKIIEEYVEYSKIEKFTPVLVFLPQKNDVLFIKKKFHFYKDFLLDIQKISGLIHIDVIDDFLDERNLDEIYSDNNEYGGHFSKEGNKKVATIINKKLSESNVI